MEATHDDRFTLLRLFLLMAHDGVYLRSRSWGLSIFYMKFTNQRFRNSDDSSHHQWSLPIQIHTNVGQIRTTPLISCTSATQ
jgi:hypothetical protein